MYNFLKDLGKEEPRKKDIHNLLLHLDQDSDGKIDCKEFEVLIIEVLKILI